MKLLLDTNAFLWWLESPELLKADARLAIANSRNFVFVSAVSIVEIVIKEGLGKLDSVEPPESRLAECRFRELAFSVAHGSAMRSLPPIHKDPFDRMLLAQAMTESMLFVTRDGELAEYGLPLLMA